MNILILVDGSQNVSLAANQLKEGVVTRSQDIMPASMVEELCRTKPIADIPGLLMEEWWSVLHGEFAYAYQVFSCPGVVADVTIWVTLTIDINGNRMVQLSSEHAQLKHVVFLNLYNGSNGVWDKLITESGLTPSKYTIIESK